ncbi:MAG TPA: DNA translocase FtsK [Acidobacteriota bacterium]|nr:DNA translocase FtsK [Acidobacteriota bacterium]
MRWFAKLSYQRKSEIFGFLLIVLCLFCALSLATHTQGDDRWIGADSDEVWVDAYYARNMAGTVGALISWALYEWFGVVAWLLVVLFGFVGLRRFLRSVTHKPIAYTFGILAAVFLFGVMVMLPAAGRSDAWAGGDATVSGRIGRIVAGWMVGLFGVVGGILVLGSVLVGAVLLVVPWKTVKGRLPAPKRRSAARQRSQKPLFTRLHDMAASWRNAVGGFKRRLTLWRGREGEPEPETEGSWDFDKSPVQGAPDENEPPNWAAYRTPASPSAVPNEASDPTPETAEPRQPRLVIRKEGEGAYQFPPLHLLQSAQAHHQRRIDSRGGELLRQALDTFDIGIDGAIEVFPGPVITRYEFRPAPGVKVNQVVGLADDLALALSASRVRIVAPVPGKAAVGVEVPNQQPETVGLERVLQSSTYLDSEAALPLGLGETIDGRPFVVDLAGMPHLLIAGATGSGKSVCINVIIASILFRHHPNDVRLLFIDPKRLELSIYSGIPHMARPVVTDPRAAERLLAEATREMDERYKRLAAAGVRNIVDYNTKAAELEKLPYLIIVVDELADLMMSQSASRIELLITRIAQMARAVGIHLILATQRPSVDVITGLIKANFSCRVAFQVASKTDSRTILDANGAEKLLGKGDMLFLAPGQPQPVRIHGAMISGAETSALVEFLSGQSVVPVAVASFAATRDDPDSDGSGLDDEESDPLFAQAADVVTRHKQGSVSLLQRRLGVGYQRAARLIDRLEEAGIVGGYDGSKAREVLISRDEFEERFAKSVG